MDKDLINSHDKFFKSLFSRKEAVSEFVAKILPSPVADKLDTDTLVLDSNEYIDKKLKTHFSDVVYRCAYHTDKEEAVPIKISLLFEHKSYPESHPHLQLLRYLLNIWETQKKQKEAFTPVIPIIFYHGMPVWHKKPLDDYFSTSDEYLQQFMPRFDYLLVDTKQYEDAIFKELNTLELQMGMLIMKNIFQTETMLQKFAYIFSEIEALLATEKGRHYFESIATYLYYNTNLTTETLVEKMNTVSAQAKDTFVSTAMRLEKRGEERGIEKEKNIVALSMLREGIADSLIKKCTQITTEQLSRLKRQLTTDS